MKSRTHKSIVALFAIGTAVAMAQDNAIFDDFENGDLATGGAGTTNAGFFKATSGGTAVETNGVAIVTATAKNATYGIVSTNSFNAMTDAAAGFTAQWVVPSLPLGGNYGTMSFTLQSGSGLFSQTNALSFAVKYITGGSTFSVDAYNGGSSTSLVSAIASGQGNSGYTLTATVNEAGWSITGLNVNTNGTWVDGFTYADLFDETTHVGGFINRGGVATSKELRLSHVTVIGADGEPPPADPALIVGIEPVEGSLIKLIFSAPSPSTTYPKSTTDLAAGGWAGVPHSDDGINPFVVTNLDYSSASDTNVAIYVEATNAAAFYSFGAE